MPKNDEFSLNNEVQKQQQSNRLFSKRKVGVVGRRWRRIFNF